MTDLNAIKSRLGSISDTSMSKLPKAVQTLLKEDLPRLVELAEVNLSLKSAIPGSMSSILSLLKSKEILDSLAPTSPAQQIKDMPW